MYRKWTVVVLFLLPLFGHSYNWQVFGGVGYKVFNAFLKDSLMPNTICSSAGLIIWDDCGGWTVYGFHGLNALSAVSLNKDTLLVGMGNDSTLDGIYFFDLPSKLYSLAFKTAMPRLLFYQEKWKKFMAGGNEGLFVSDDGKNWVEDTVFSTGRLYSYACLEKHTVISSAKGNFHAIEPFNWTNLNSSVIYADLSFGVYYSLPSGYDSVLYAVYGGDSRSSGLYSSKDFGKTMDLDYYSVRMSAVATDILGLVVTGWYNGLPNEEGVAAAFPGKYTKLFFNMNTGLPCKNINRISRFEMFENDPEMLVSTDSGAFIFSDYPSDIMIGQEEPVKIDHEIKLVSEPGSKIRINNTNLANPVVSAFFYDLTGQLICKKDQMLETTEMITIPGNPGGLVLACLNMKDGSRFTFKIILQK